MTLLISGLGLWILAHLFKRLMPAARAALGNRGKGLVALALLTSVVLMVIGYRGADINPVYTPMPGAGHLNNLLMFIAVYAMGVGSVKGVLGSKIRHPMLTGVVIWSFAHLLVNGDLASLVLFGSLGVWAVVEMLVINRAEGPWQRPAPGPRSKDVKLIGMTFILYVIIAGVHALLNHNPFQGTYG